MNYKFKEDIERGEIGENIIYNYFINLSNVNNVIDVRDDEKYRDMDIDFIVIFSNGEKLNIEIKTDYEAHKTGNLPYEYRSNIKNNTIGCLEKTKADYVFWYIYENQKIYKMDIKSVKKFIHSYKNKYSQIDMGDNAKGYLLPIEWLKDEDMIEEILCK
jgi:hypothetical protein